MSRALLAAALVAGVGAAAAAPRDRLTAAFRAGDRLELERTGRNLGAPTLAAELRSRDRARVMAALAAAPHAGAAWTLLPDLAELTGSADRPRAAAAARAGAEIARALTPDLRRRLDVPADLLEPPLEAFRRTASDSGRWPDVRVHALDASRDLARAIGEEPGWAARALANDDEPEVRRAVLERLPQPLTSARRAMAAERARTDPDPRVAAVALQALCGGIAAGDPSEPTLRALGDEGLARLRAMLFEPPRGAPDGALLDAALCAHAAGDLHSRRALARFRGRLDPALEAVIAERLSWLEQ